mgnify:FL=1
MGSNSKKADFQKIGQTFGIDPVIARLIRNRDVEGMENIRSYLYGTLEELPSPWLLKDMKKGNWKNPIRYYAVDHIEERLENYYAKNIKHSNDIIDHNLGFFESLNE